MGKTPKPLTIIIAPVLLLKEGKETPWAKALVEKGHNVKVWNDPAFCEADLILGPNCARFLPGMEFMLDSLVKGARAVKFPKEKKPS